MKDIYFLNDGDVLPHDLIDYFKESDYSLKRISGEITSKIINMVGIIIENDVEIYVFPKHFNNPSIEKTHLLIELILKYYKKNEHLNLYMNDDFVTNYAFDSFYNILRYYENYGIYHKEESTYRNGLQGKISWKRSIKSEHMIMTMNGIVLTNFQVKNIEYSKNIVSRAMISAINYTSRMFKSFINLPIINNGEIEEIFFMSNDSLIYELQLIRNILFKDSQIRLIDSLIEFYSNTYGGGKVQFKHYNFELIWEDMVHDYLVNHFIGVENDEILFSREIIKKIDFEKGAHVKINDFGPHQNIIIDHYYSDANNQYIFDSKYYSRITGLNYKQITYGFSLSENFRESEHDVDSRNCYNALFLPGNFNNRIHFQLDSTLSKDKIYKNTIHEYYLDVENLLLLYLKY